jgi:hypothetical protein
LKKNRSRRRPPNQRRGIAFATNGSMPVNQPNPSANDTRTLLRELITEADHLSRVSYEAFRGVRSWRFSALRTTLQRLERRAGGEAPQLPARGELDLVYQRIVEMASACEPRERETIDHMRAAADRLRSKPSRVTLASPPIPLIVPRRRTPMRLKGPVWGLPLAFVALAVPLLALAFRYASR